MEVDKALANPSEDQEPALKKTKMSSTDDGDDTKPRRYRRRKVAIFFAYCGVGYQGMQKNPGAKTIEGDLDEALFFSGAVPEGERGQHKRYDWARSARTDKGVSAVGQVVSGSFIVDPPGFIERLNSNLSPQIRIFGYKRVTPSFSAKKFCDRRRYVYLLPVFALDPSCHRDRESVLASLGKSGQELVKCGECSERGRKVVGLMGNKREGFVVESGISSNTLDAFMLDSEDNLKEDIRVNVCVDNNHSAGVPLKNDVGGVDSEGLVQSGISPNTGAAVVLEAEEMVKEEVEVNVCSENGNNDGVQKCLDTEASAVESEISAQLGISSNSEAAPLLADEVKEKVESTVSLLENDDVADLETNGEGKKEKRSEFKYGDEVRERFNKILKYYEGTHNFHNFTTRTKAEDPSAKRYIVSFEANTTLTIEGIEFVKCEVVGQSFMLHQIRKMMGLAVAVMRNFAPESIYETAFDQIVNINVPTAPEVGLYLDECFFTSYNNKFKKTHEEVSMKAYAEEAEEFKLKYIHSHIANTEHKEGAVALWLHSLNRRNYPDLCPSVEAVGRAAEGDNTAADLCPSDGGVERAAEGDNIAADLCPSDGGVERAAEGDNRAADLCPSDGGVERAAEGDNIAADLCPSDGGVERSVEGDTMAVVA